MLGERRRPRWGLGRVDLLVRRRPHRQLRPGPALSPPGLGLLPYGNGVHYDSEDQRRPLLQGLVEKGDLPTSHATDDGVGLVYEGTDLVEAVTDRPGAAAYVIERQPDGTVSETRIEPRLLG